VSEFLNVIYIPTYAQSISSVNVYWNYSDIFRYEYTIFREFENCVI